MSILTSRKTPISVISTVCYLGRILISHLLHGWSWSNFHSTAFTKCTSLELPIPCEQLTGDMVWLYGTEKEDLVKESELERKSYRSDFGEYNGEQIFMEDRWTLSNAEEIRKEKREIRIQGLVIKRSPLILKRIVSIESILALDKWNIDEELETFFRRSRYERKQNDGGYFGKENRVKERF